MKYLFLHFLFLPIGIAQVHDHIWLSGQGNSTDGITPSGYFINNFIDFSKTPFSQNIGKKSYPMYYGRCSYSDSSGNLVMYSNLLQIFNKFEEVMLGGESINDGVIKNEWIKTGYPCAASARVIPMPGNDSILLMMYQHQDSVNTQFSSWKRGPLMYALIAPAMNNGKGQVLTKDQIFRNVSLNNFQLIRHANGRDWWVLTGEEYNLGIIINKDLISTDGFHFNYKKDTLITWYEMTGAGSWITFSPSGSKIMAQTTTDTFNTKFWLYSFDRCNGSIDFVKAFNPINSGIFSWSVFSENERYFYCSYNSLYQLDVEINSNTQIDTLAEPDGFYDEFPIFTTGFVTGELTPDHRIFWGTGNGTKYNQVIHRPDLPGFAANMQQHGIQLNGYAVGQPHFPNYRLGPLEGSSCDTIGFHPSSPWNIVNSTGTNWCFQKSGGPPTFPIILRLYYPDGAVAYEYVHDSTFPSCFDFHFLTVGNYTWRIWEQKKKSTEGTFYLMK